MTAVMEKLEALHANSVIRRIKTKSVKVDLSYQRIFSEKIVDLIADDWNELASEVILVSDRGPRADGTGGLWIINGQHRVRAAVKLGIEELDARVVNLRKEENPVGIEAALRLQTGVRLGDKAFERFKAQLAAGNEESLSIIKILSKLGTKPILTPGETDGIMAVAALEKIYRADDTGALLTDTLELIKETWGGFGDKRASSGMMKGIAWFIFKHGPVGKESVDHARAVRLLGSISAAALETRGRQFAGTMGGPLWVNIYKAIIDLYNEGLSDKNKVAWQLKGVSGFGRSRSGGSPDTAFQ